MAYDADAIVVGAGLAGLVAAAELADAGRRVILLDQEPERALGGQAFWSLGGLFMVDTPEQRRLGVRDSYELALSDWMCTAGFDREEDRWPRRWAEAYVAFAAGEKHAWLREQGVRLFPLVQWAERGGYGARGPGNSVPRFHIAWGTGPGVLEPFVRRVRAAEERGLVELRYRHRVTELIREGGALCGVGGEVLKPDSTRRGAPSSRAVRGTFELRAQAAVVASGGIGANHDLIRRNWPERYGEPPQEMLSGVPDHVDGLMLGVVRRAGGSIIGEDRMWNYPEGVANHSPIWSRHGIRILPGPSSLWLDAAGEPLPFPLIPGADALGALEHIAKSGHGYSWFVLNRRILGKEFALSGSEQNPDLTGRSWPAVLRRALPGAPAPVEEFARRSPEFIEAQAPEELARRMNALTGEGLVDPAKLREVIEARDRQAASGLGKDPQLAAIRSARRFVGDRLIRVARPHRLLDPAAGPLVAVRLSILTRKTLGGIETDLAGRVLGEDGEPVPGLYAAGEASGFGGGGMHGYRALEGTFLGGCLFSGRVAGRAAAAAVG
ncbi:FAD-binding dehydrogenase [Rubrobacter taiwanensis]|uniref:FAD-binding dehydrogenase n=1 Tax=Rubrobacter taiwanensis TaxID=185139 RepID=A0A4R1BU02_9ACTN|nr:FAD-binding dehydrogenase [Rubrobacter taiwanensis]TCJ20776.1 FAD-binding dehydrogenase [Rubrobacter taiwanensis]